MPGKFDFLLSLKRACVAQTCNACQHSMINVSAFWIETKGCSEGRQLLEGSSLQLPRPPRGLCDQQATV